MYIHIILIYFVVEYNGFACVSALSLHSESTNFNPIEEHIRLVIAAIFSYNYCI